MPLMHNEFAGREEVLFITYDEIIRNPYPLLLQQIIGKYKQVYQDFLDIERIEGMSMGELEIFCAGRTEKNIFQELAKIDFDTDVSLNEFQEKFDNLYALSPLLEMGNGLHFMASQKFLKEVYFYTPTYDMRVHLDIQRTFGDMKRFQYVFGNFEDVIEQLDGITGYILNDINLTPTLFFKEKAYLKNILIANYGYNYYEDEDSEEIKPKVDIGEYYTDDMLFDFAFFTPMKLSEKILEESMEEDEEKSSNSDEISE